MHCSTQLGFTPPLSRRDAHPFPFIAPTGLPNLSPEWLEELGFSTSMVEEKGIAQEGTMPNDYHTTVASNGIACRIKKLVIPSGVILHHDDASITQ